MTESDVQFHEPHKPSANDIAQAAELPLHACPRRYCWWWRSLKFEWAVPTGQGCEITQRAPKVPGWKNSDKPCCRTDLASETDHFEPREPHLIEDGFAPNRFNSPKT